MPQKLGWCGLALLLVVGLVGNWSAAAQGQVPGGLVLHVATPAQISAAITSGLTWLEGKMNVDTNQWPNPGSPLGQVGDGTFDPVALTAFAVLKFEDDAYQHGMNPFDPNYQYSAEVIAGWEYLSTQMTSVAVSQQILGYPEPSYPLPPSNGLGICFGSWPYVPYRTGIVMMALQASDSPTRGFPNPGSPHYNGRTFCDILQDCVDWVAWAQVDPPSSNPGRGGWKYDACDNCYSWPAYRADNSVSQWTVSGLLAAEAWGIHAPQWVADELFNRWLATTGSYYSGGRFVYETSNSYGGAANADCGLVATTAAGLIELTYCGKPSLPPSRWADGANFIGGPDWNAVYPDSSNPAILYPANIGNLYAMYSVMKAAMVADPVVVTFGAHDWRTEYDYWLVQNQVLTGSVPPTGYWPAWNALPWETQYGQNEILATELALLILERTAPRQPFCQTGPCGVQAGGGLAGDVIASDNHVTHTALGNIRIEECVTRRIFAYASGPVCVDAYEYRVSNIDFLDSSGCGVTEFTLPRAPNLPVSSGGGSATTAAGSTNWILNLASSDITWSAPSSADAIMPGYYGTFGFEVPCLSTDAPVTGYVATCSQSGLEVETTGPDALLPDLVVSIDSAECSGFSLAGSYLFTVSVHAVVTNIGAGSVPAGMVVTVDVPAISLPNAILHGNASSFVTLTSDLAPNSSIPVFVALVIECFGPQYCFCPPKLPLWASVDISNTVTESDDSNNDSKPLEICCTEGSTWEPPNLGVGAPANTSTTCDGSTCNATVAWWIKNTGSLPTGACSATVTDLNTATVSSPIAVPSLQPGDSWLLIWTSNVPGCLLNVKVDVNVYDEILGDDPLDNTNTVFAICQ